MTDHPFKILEWLAEMGDDIPLTDEPINRFEESEAAQKVARAKVGDKRKAPQTPPRSSKGSLQERVAAIKDNAKANIPQKSAAVLPDETVVAAARELAAKADTTEALKANIMAFEGCNLRRNAKHSVFAVGNPSSTVMLIDEHPSREEDQQGIPFAGRSNLLLEKMLAAIGIKLDDVYQVAALPWHPPGNRSPTPPELEICKPFIERHIELAGPKLVIAMGNTPSRLLFQPNAQALSIRGKWQSKTIGGASFDCIATLGPNFLLKQPVQKRLAWEDLLMIKSKMGELK